MGSPEPAERPRAVVLVVDDEETVRNVTARALEVMGYESVTAADGQSGVAAFAARAAEIGVVLLDMTLPGMSGNDVYQAIRTHRPGARVVVMSGYSQSEATQAFGKDQLAGYLQKPYGLEELRAVVERALAG